MFASMPAARAANGCVVLLCFAAPDWRAIPNASNKTESGTVYYCDYAGAVSVVINGEVRPTSTA
jgi:hypothetical protein